MPGGVFSKPEFISSSTDGRDSRLCERESLFIWRSREVALVASRGERVGGCLRMPTEVRSTGSGRSAIIFETAACGLVSARLSIGRERARERESERKSERMRE
eukprot:scaffold321597_cov32-Tisochrysis_lutea.AAC.1